jgi:uncharacterized membrane protein
MKMPLELDGAPSLARSQILERNLEMLGRREKTQRLKRSLPQRVCGTITKAAGEPWFMGLHALWFGGWILLNSGVLPRIRPFDPFPFLFLTFSVSLEAIFLSLAILMSQSLETRQADERAKLDLQINLLAEREATKTLQLLRAICIRNGMPEAEDPELLDLLRPTRADHVLEELEQQGKQAESGIQVVKA